MKKRGKDIGKLVNVLSLLASGKPLPAQYKDHSLTGNLHDFRECHIEPDWLLMYQIRLATSRSSGSGGAGLGLAIAREIVELHRGTITAKSQGEEIEFEVTLPLS